jgi:hypothetical protein
MHKFIENILTGYGKASTALGSETSDLITVAAFKKMSNYDLYTAVAHVTNVASGKIVTLRLWEATAAAGTGSQSLAITDTFTAAATSDTDVLIAQARGAQLTAGYSYIGAKLSTNDTTGAEVCGLLQFQLNARYGQETLAA